MAIFILFVLLDLIVLFICNRLAKISAGRNISQRPQGFPPRLNPHELQMSGQGMRGERRKCCNGCMADLIRLHKGRAHCSIVPLLLIKATCECREEVECKDISLEIPRERPRRWVLSHSRVWIARVKSADVLLETRNISASQYLFILAFIRAAHRRGSCPGLRTQWK